MTESRRLDGASVAVRSVVESITAPGTQRAPQLVNATNVYVLPDVGWCLAMHHASPPEQADAAPEDEAVAAACAALGGQGTIRVALAATARCAVHLLCRPVVPTGIAGRSRRLRLTRCR